MGSIQHRKAPFPTLDFAPSTPNAKINKSECNSGL